jgi:hypothetical protein
MPVSLRWRCRLPAPLLLSRPSNLYKPVMRNGDVVPMAHAPLMMRQPSAAPLHPFGTSGRRARHPESQPADDRDLPERSRAVLRVAGPGPSRGRGGRCAEACLRDVQSRPRGPESVQGATAIREFYKYLVKTKRLARSVAKAWPATAAQVDAGVPPAPGDRPGPASHPQRFSLAAGPIFELGLMTLRISSAPNLDLS